MRRNEHSPQHWCGQLRPIFKGNDCGLFLSLSLALTWCSLAGLVPDLVSSVVQQYVARSRLIVVGARRWKPARDRAGEAGILSSRVNRTGTKSKGNTALLILGSASNMRRTCMAPPEECFGLSSGREGSVPADAASCSSFILLRQHRLKEDYQAPTFCDAHAVLAAAAQKQRWLGRAALDLAARSGLLLAGLESPSMVGELHGRRLPLASVACRPPETTRMAVVCCRQRMLAPRPC